MSWQTAVPWRIDAHFFPHKIPCQIAICDTLVATYGTDRFYQQPIELPNDGSFFIIIIGVVSPWKMGPWVARLFQLGTRYPTTHTRKSRVPVLTFL